MTLNEKCSRLHHLLNEMEKHSFTAIEISKLSINNGIYIIFEKGEKAHGCERIVRIGTHNKPYLLQQRLNQHRQKRKGIFRRMIGCAALNKNNPNDSDIKRWYDKEFSSISKEKVSMIHESVTNYIENKMVFVVFEVKGTGKKEKGTLFWEEKIIATIAGCNKCSSSKNWFGNYLPENLGNFSSGKKHGLWLSEGIGKEPLSDTEFEELEKIITKSKGRHK